MGAGLQTKFEPEFSEGYVYDEEGNYCCYSCDDYDGWSDWHNDYWYDDDEYYYDDSHEYWQPHNFAVAEEVIIQEHVAAPASVHGALTVVNDDKFICGLQIVDGNASLKDNEEWLVIDSGSQVFACRPNFGSEYQVDDSDCAIMYDIQSNAIKGPGKRVMNMDIIGEDFSLPTRMSFDVCNNHLAHNVAPVTEHVRRCRCSFHARGRSLA